MEGYKSVGGGRISGWADKQTDGDGEAAHRGFYQIKGRKQWRVRVCVKMSPLTDMSGHLDVTEANRFSLSLQHRLGAEY